MAFWQNYSIILLYNSIKRCEKTVILKPQRELEMENNKKVIREHLDSDMLLRVKEDILPFIATPLHYHSHYELVWIKEGYGTRIVGDRTESFAEGDMVLMYPNLPHVWENDSAFYQGNPALRADVLVIHFSEEVIQMLHRISDLSPIKEILKMSQRGILITGQTKQEIVNLMEKILHAMGTERIIIFLRIFEILSKRREDLSLLASESFPKYYDELKYSRMRKIDEYIVQNFGRKISIDEMAGILYMSTSSFCRYFKDRTGTTFVNYLNDFRLLYAKKLLEARQLKIVSVAEASGFGDVSYFNRIFKQKTGMTPTEYLEKQEGKDAG